MRLRRLLRAYHRDVGYFVSALTLSYCVSGVAVNHMADWNPNYAISREEVQLKPLSGDLSAMEAAVVSQLGIEAASVRGRLREGADQLKIFLPEGGEVAVRISTGAAKVKRVEPRAGLYQVNALHLNRLKGGWTYVADAFALLLGSLALTGLFMLRGPLGMGGRGKWLVGAGLVVPVLALWLASAT